MKGFVHRISMVLGCVVVCAGVAAGQPSGVPGDGIPDVYYFQGDGGIANTTFGPISMPAGTLTLDTDGSDVAAFFVGGADITTTGCSLCDGGNLPGTDSLSDVGSYTLGYSGGSSQWIRTDPLQGLGFRGVVSYGYVDGSDMQVTPWPEDVVIGPVVVFDFPDENTGLANYGAGLTEADFPLVFDDGTGEASWNVQFESDASGGFFTNVTVVPPVPEPAAGGLMGLAGLGLLWLRRRG